MSLTEADIIPGRHYLCRVKESGNLWVCKAGPKSSEGLGMRSGLLMPGVCLGYADRSIEVLRELDLEALAAGAEIGDPPCAHTSWEVCEGGARTCADCREPLGPNLDAINWAKDVREETYRPNDAVNQTASGVRLVHVPTGVTAAVDHFRSQHTNRAIARKALARRVAYRRYEIENGEAP